MASLYLNEQLPTTSEQALREFDQRYLTLLSGADPTDWAARFEFQIGGPRVTFPMSAATAKFRETKAAPGTFEGMAEGSFDLKVVEYDAGHEADVYRLTTNAFEYARWQQAAAMLINAERWFVAEKLAALLEDGVNQFSQWELAFNSGSTVKFFSTAHEANPSKPGLATFSNYQASTLSPVSVTNIVAEATNMKKEIKDLNGRLMRVNPSEIWVPPAKSLGVANLINQAHLASGEDNPIFGKYKVVEIPQLTVDADDWFLVDPDLMSREGMTPLIAVSHRPSDTLALREWNESSDFFRATGKVRKGVHIWKGFSLGFPHGIRLVKGA
jgi:hypothetical protein